MAKPSAGRRPRLASRASAKKAALSEEERNTLFQLKIMREQIFKWNGKMPEVLAGGSGQGVLLNIPAATAEKK